MMKVVTDTRTWNYPDIRYVLEFYLIFLCVRMVKSVIRMEIIRMQIIFNDGLDYPDMYLSPDLCNDEAGY